jgi:hypothetical protein
MNFKLFKESSSQESLRRILLQKSGIRIYSFEIINHLNLFAFIDLFVILQKFSYNLVKLSRSFNNCGSELFGTRRCSKFFLLLLLDFFRV